MKRITFLWLVLLALTQTAYAQISHVLDQVPDSVLRENAFDELDTSSLLTTQFLWDRDYPDVNMFEYSGHSDDPASFLMDSKQAYIEIRNMRVDSTKEVYPIYEEFMQGYRESMHSFDAVPILLYDLTFNRISPTAISDGNLQYLNGVFSIPSTATSSPFIQEQFTSVGLFIEEVPVSDTLRFVLPYFGYISNNWGAPETIQQVQLDFGDGNGYQTVSWDGPIEVYFGGQPDQVKELKIKIYRKDGSIDYAKTSFKTGVNCAAPQPDQAPWPKLTTTVNQYVKEVYEVREEWDNASNTMVYDTIYRWVPTQVTREFEYLMEATIPYSGETARGNVYIKYRDNANHGGTPRFEKPIIFVEGIDFRFGLRYESNGYTRFGTVGWDAMWGCDPDMPFSVGMPYLDSLTAEGYDIIMLDFEHGSDYIQRNAFLLKTLIDSVNHYKVGHEQNAVVGFSMGGQVARYGLAYMEHHNIPHCTRTFVSFDSPWNGAHIPMGLQCSLAYLGDVRNEAGAKEFMYWIRRPAAEQLLVYHYDRARADFSTRVTNGSEVYTEFSFPGGQFAPKHLRGSFLTDLSAVGDHPKALRNLSIVNGSDEAINIFSQGDQFIHLAENCHGFFQRAQIYSAGRWNGYLAYMRMGTGNRYKFVSNNIEPLDHIAGSTREDMGGLREQLWKGLAKQGCPNSNVTLIQPANLFVASTSALAVNNGNWNFSIDNILPGTSNRSGLTTFDAYYAQGQNEEHVQLTHGNMQWLLKQLRLSEDVISQQFASTALTKTWNHPLESSNISGLDIDQGGKLYVNGDLSRFDGGNGASASFGLARVYLSPTCGANPVINVNNGGELILGANNHHPTRGNNQAYLHISDGAELNINTGGELLIHDGSRLIIQDGGKLKVSGVGAIATALANGQIIIEDGGELIFEQDASIVLSANSSILEIKGKLSIGNNATFSFSGNGHLILNQQIGKFDNYGNWYNDYDSYWAFGTNAKIDLSGSNSSDLVLVVAKSSHIRTKIASKPIEIKITTGLVQIAKDQQLHLGSDLIMSHVKVECLTPGQSHQGIRHWNTNSTITNCEFTDGNHLGALALNNIGGNKSALVQYSDFTGNVLGLKVTGEGADLVDCLFENNTTGVSMDYVSRSSKVSDSDFKNNDIGLKVIGQAGFSLQMVGNLVSNNTTYGVELVSVESSVFQTNQVLSNYVGIRAFGSVVDMSQEAYNCIEDNQVGIQLFAEEGYKGGIYLVDGFNRFDLGAHTNGKYITGAFCPDMPMSIYNGSFIDASNNQMPFIPRPNALPLMPVSIMHKSHCFNGTYTAIPLHFDPGTQLTSIAGACGVGGSNELDDFMYEERELNLLGGGRIIFGGPFSSGLPLRDAILSGAQNISRSSEDIRDDALALDYFQAVLSQGVQSWTTEEERMFELAYSLAKRAFTNLHQYDESYTDISNPSNDDRLTYLTTYINSELYNLVQAGNAGTYAEFLWNLDYAQLHRAGNYYSEAITHLNTASSWANGLELDRANFWKCICEAERDLVDGVIGEEDFEIQTEYCVALNPNASFKTTGSSEDSEEYEGYTVDLAEGLVTTLYPNPTDGIVHIELSAPFEGSFHVKVSDLSGRTIEELEFFNPPMKLLVDLTDLAPGIYVVSYTDEQGTILGESKQVVKH